MNKINSLFAVIIISTFAYCQNTEDVNKIKKIRIKSVDFSIISFVSVECNKFEEYFKKHKVSSITDTITINKFLNQITKLELIDSTYSKYVDTRVKIELFSDSDTSIICVGNLSLYMNDDFYKTPQGLIDFIEKIE